MPGVVGQTEAGNSVESVSAARERQAHLAATLVGDTAKSRKADEDFFALWKDAADPDIPILQQAKQEYDKSK